MPVRADGTVVDWGAGVVAAWPGGMGEAAGLAALEHFVGGGGFASYEARRHLADGSGVARISPYLHFGQLSPRHCAAAVARAGGKAVSKTFWRRLVWRDLAFWQLHHFVDMHVRPIRPHYAGMEWRDPGDPETARLLEAWRRGRTGYPLVDAGMRELWATGWMQQSVRMAAAAFLTEYLNISWTHGADWFHGTLVDADLAINSMMWQNAGKSGIDQWNFTMSPSSSYQDPKGEYVRRWVPELRGLPTKHVHAPWGAPAEALAKAGVELGRTYPERVLVDLEGAKEANRRAIVGAKVRAGPARSDAGGYDVVDVPAGSARGTGPQIRLFTVEKYRTPKGREPAGGAPKERRPKAPRGRAQQQQQGPDRKQQQGKKRGRSPKPAQKGGKAGGGRQKSLKEAFGMAGVQDGRTRRESVRELAGMSLAELAAVSAEDDCVDVVDLCGDGDGEWA